LAGAGGDQQAETQKCKNIEQVANISAGTLPAIGTWNSQRMTANNPAASTSRCTNMGELAQHQSQRDKGLNQKLLSVPRSRYAPAT